MEDVFDDCILDDFLDEDDRDDECLGVATPRRAKGKQGGGAGDVRGGDQGPRH